MVAFLYNSPFRLVVDFPGLFSKQTERYDGFLTSTLLFHYVENPLMATCRSTHWTPRLLMFPSISEVLGWNDASSRC